MLIPYRAKNPPERFPAVTIGLMVANILIYAVTTDYFLTIREGVVQDFAVSHRTLSAFRMFTAMFLHGDLFHLAGNMLFLWIFGSAVEGRLGPLKFLGVYLTAGFAGGLLQDIVVGLAFPKIFNLGASGAIMGLAGAYLYMFPFATICVVWGWSWRIGLAQWQAQWVILYFIAFDVLYGFLFSGAGVMDGIGHFCHLGGFGAGFAGVLALRARRDSEDVSNAQAVRADTQGSYQMLGLHELEALMEAQPDNADLITTFCRKAATRVDGGGYPLCLQAMQKHSRVLADQGNPETLARLVMGLPAAIGTMPTAFMLRLGSRLEGDGNYHIAELLYRHACHANPDSPDLEMALLRLARLLEQTSPEKGQAAAVYAELLRRFPYSPHAPQAKAALGRLGPATLVFSAGNPESASTPAAMPEGFAAVTSPAMVREAQQRQPPPQAPPSLEDMAPLTPRAAAAPTAPQNAGGGNTATTTPANNGGYVFEGDDTLRPLGG